MPPSMTRQKAGRAWHVQGLSSEPGRHLTEGRRTASPTRPRSVSVPLRIPHIAVTCVPADRSRIWGCQPLFCGAAHGTKTAVPIRYGLSLTNAAGLSFRFLFREVERGCKPAIIELQQDSIVAVLSRREHLSLNDLVGCLRHHLNAFGAISPTSIRHRVWRSQRMTFWCNQSRRCVEGARDRDGICIGRYEVAEALASPPNRATGPRGRRRIKYARANGFLTRNGPSSRRTTVWLPGLKAQEFWLVE